MSTDSTRLPSDAELRFWDAMRRILSLTPEQQEEVKRKGRRGEQASSIPKKRPKVDSLRALSLHRYVSAQLYARRHFL